MSTTTTHKGRWRLVKTERSGGGLFELEIRLTFQIFDTTSGECILMFRGLQDCSYATDGSGWTFNRAADVQDIVLEEHAAIVIGSSHTVRYQLPLRQLTSDEIHQLSDVFVPFQEANAKYQHEEQWSSDVSIPAEAIAESRRLMQERWAVLHERLVVLGIAEMGFYNMLLPKRIKGGRRAMKALLLWLERNGHLQKPS